jgi:hypothetical protein
LLCQIGWGIWGYRITDMTSHGGAVDEAVWSGPYLDPAHPYEGPPSGISCTLYYSYQGTEVFQISGENVDLGQTTLGGNSARDYFESLTPPRWFETIVQVPVLGPNPNNPDQIIQLALNGLYTQWDLPTDHIPRSYFPMKQPSSVYAGYRGWVYDGPHDQNNTQVVNIQSTVLTGTGVTDDALVAGRFIYPEMYFYAAGGTQTKGYPL